jgi:hypothetical protein
MTSSRQAGVLAAVVAIGRYGRRATKAMEGKIVGQGEIVGVYQR